jgi:uncharacterized membrane protein
VLKRAWRGVQTALRRYFVAGVLAVAPISITLWALWAIVQRLDNLVLPRLLKLVDPSGLHSTSIPFVGALFTLAVILLCGVIARHLFGFELLRLSERLLLRVPFARSIYGAVKQLFEALFVSPVGGGFRRVVLVEYPRKGVWAIAFTTGPASDAIQGFTPDNLVNVFVPTTPNPTSGFYLLVPEQDIVALDITVEQAFKLVMSAGLVPPDSPQSPDAPREADPTQPVAAAPEPGLSQLPRPARET